MKNIIKSFLRICLVMLLTVVVLNTTSTIKADSGWDTDYDSGSSSSSSSFGSSSSSSHHNSGSKNKEYTRESYIIAAIYGLIIFGIIGIQCIIFLPYIKNDKKLLYNKLKEEDANKVIPDFDINEFNFKAYQIFYDVQMAWMNLDYDKLKELLTDELYNSYVMQLEALKVKEQRNVMKEFVLNESSIVELKEENGYYIAKVYLDVKFYDYVEEIKTKKVLRGNSNNKVNNIYIITFISTKGKSNNINKCPNCGAKVEGNVTGICNYCKSKLINENYTWVMSKKEKIVQR